MSEETRKPGVKTRGGVDGDVLRLSTARNRFEPSPETEATPFDDSALTGDVEDVVGDVATNTDDIGALRARLDDLERRYRLLLQDYIRRFGMVAALGGENAQALQQG